MLKIFEFLKKCGIKACFLRLAPCYLPKFRLNGEGQKEKSDFFVYLFFYGANYYCNGGKRGLLNIKRTTHRPFNINLP